MQLEHEFSVPVPVAQAWDVLLDVERIAPCMPGATVESFDGETIVGRVKVKVGPIQVTYAGTARFTEKDESARRAVIEASAKEARGSGTANATITAQLHDDGGSSTNVKVTTRPRDHRQARAVRSRRHGRGRRQAARQVRRLPGRRARQRGGRRSRTSAGAFAGGCARAVERWFHAARPAGGRRRCRRTGTSTPRPGRRRPPPRSGERTTTPIDLLDTAGLPGAQAAGAGARRAGGAPRALAAGGPAPLTTAVRRQFCALGERPGGGGSPGQGRRMKLLIIGGTSFLGRATAVDALRPRLGGHHLQPRQERTRRRRCRGAPR